MSESEHTLLTPKEREIVFLWMDVAMGEGYFDEKNYKEWFQVIKKLFPESEIPKVSYLFERYDTKEIRYSQELLEFVRK